MGVPEAVHLHARPEPGCLACREPDVVAEPTARDMPVSINSTDTSGAVFSAGPPFGAVDRIRRFAVITAALARRIPAERAMPVRTPRRVLLRPPQRAGIV